MVEIRSRKIKKTVNSVLYNPYDDDHFGVILIINDTPESPWRGKEWLEEFKTYGEADYDAHEIRYAYVGMPVFIYVTSKKSVVADAVIDNDENKVYHLVNFRLIDEPDIIDKDELIEMKLFKKVPIISKYISKTDYETIESLF